MKTEISRDSHQPEKHYSGVYQQQGRMLTDADWNEGVEILKAHLNDALKDVVGNKAGGMGGTARHRALKVLKALATDDLTIQPGHVHVEGRVAQVSGDANIAYDAQPDFPGAPNLPGSPPTQYALYADLWERTVTHLMDERLRDKGLHGADTCTRKQTLAQVKWCPKNVDPEQSAKNPCKGDAKLSVTLLQKSTQPDPCDPCADQVDVVSKVGNTLFRVEVHDVKGDADGPTEITLKWSGENGAQQFALKNSTGGAVEPPVEFKSGKWTYEFFDETTEKHLGVHLAPGFAPARDTLTQGYANATSTRAFVRRWDGFCRLTKQGGNWKVTEAFDKDQPDSGSVSFTDISNVKLTINLDALKLDLRLKHSFVAGDYWLTEVREAEHKPNSKLMVNATPQGIEHRYLTLGRVKGGILQPNPEADRKFAFPSLTEMTRLFMAGGDGQEVAPGQPLPQPLRVGVANGEWAVEGATVRFEIKSGGGSLSPVNGGKTNTHGIAKCHWTPNATLGANCRVKATLVDPDHEADASMDMDPAVYFYANLVSANQVAYKPACPASAQKTVHGRLASDAAVSLTLGTDGYYTVKEVLDALLCKLKARHIPYNPNKNANTTNRWKDIKEQQGTPGKLTEPDTVQKAIDQLIIWLESTDIRYDVPNCGTAASPTVRSLLSIPSGSRKIDKVFDELLCAFKATHLPIVKNADLCDTLKPDAIKTVQDALNALCRIRASVEPLFRLLFDWGVLCGIVPSLIQRRAGRIRITPGTFMDRSGRITTFDGGVFDLSKLKLREHIKFRTPQALVAALAKDEVCLALGTTGDGKTVSLYVAPAALAFGPDDPGFRESIQNCLKDKEIIKLDEVITRLPNDQRIVANKLLIASSGGKAFSGSAKLTATEARGAAAMNEGLLQEFQRVASPDETKVLKARIQQAKKDNPIGNAQGAARQVSQMEQATAVLGAFLRSDEERLRRCLCQALFPHCPPDLGTPPFLVPIGCVRGSFDNASFTLQDVCPFRHRKQAMTWRSLQYFIGETRGTIANRLAVSCCGPKEKDDSTDAPGMLYDPEKYTRLDISELAGRRRLFDELPGWTTTPAAEYKTKISLDDLNEADATKLLNGNGIEITSTINVDDPRAFEVIAEKSVGLSTTDQLISAGSVRPGDKVGLLLKDGVAKGYVLLERRSDRLSFPARTALVSTEDSQNAEALVNATNAAKAELLELSQLRDTLSTDVVKLKTDVAALDAARKTSVAAVKEVETQLTELTKTRAKITKEVEAVHKELTSAEDSRKKLVEAVRANQPVTVVTGTEDPELISRLAGAGVTTVADISKLTSAKIGELVTARILNRTTANKLRTDAKDFLKRPLG